MADQLSSFKFAKPLKRRFSEIVRLDKEPDVLYDNVVEAYPFVWRGVTQ